MQNDKYEGCPVSARGRARALPRVLEGSDLPSPAVDAVILFYFWQFHPGYGLSCIIFGI